MAAVAGSGWVTMKLCNTYAARLSVDTIVFVQVFVDISGGSYIVYITDCDTEDEIECAIFKIPDVPQIVSDIILMIMRNGGSFIDEHMLVWGKCLYNRTMHCGAFECIVAYFDGDCCQEINTEKMHNRLYIPRYYDYIRDLFANTDTTCKMLRRPWRADQLCRSRH